MKPPTKIVITARSTSPAQRLYRVTIDVDDCQHEAEFTCRFDDVPARVSESLAGMVNA